MTHDWKEEAKKLRFEDALSWSQVAEQMHDYFPTLNHQQTLEKVRGYLRKCKGYTDKGIALKTPNIHHVACENGMCTLYIVSDVHIGAYGFQRDAFMRYIAQIAADDTAIVVVAGDLIDNATLGSKGCAYRQTMTPQKQKETVIELLKPIRDKIVAVVYGNHEERTFKQTGNDIMYDICTGLGVLDCYCGVQAELQINIAKQKYKVYMAHNIGKSEAKLRSMATSFADADLLIGGHIHQPKHVTVPQRLCGGKCRDVEVVISNAWLKDEDYAVSAAYNPVSMKPIRAVLNGDTKRIDVIG